MFRPSVGKVFQHYVKHQEDVVHSALNEFTDSSYASSETTLTEEEVQSFFGSWFLFDYRLPPEKKSLLETYLQKNENSLSAAEKKYYHAILNSQTFNIFEVLRVDLGHGLRLRCLPTGVEYEISEKSATFDLEIGQAIVGRLWHTGEVWQLAPDILVWPPEATPDLYELAEKISDDDPITPQIIWNIFARPVIHSLDEGKAALADFLRAHEADPKLQPEAVMRWLKETQKIPSTIERMLAYVRLEQDGLDQLMEILNLIWNKLSVTERGGSVDGPSDWEPGPIEYSLIRELNGEMTEKIKPQSYISNIDLNKAVKKFQTEWIDTPREHAGGKTPRQLVAAERALHGHPIQDWTVELKIELWGDAKEERSHALLRAGITAHNQGNILEAEDFYRQLIDENHQSHQGWGNLGLVLAAQGRKHEAIKALEEAIAIQPDYQLARDNLARIKAATMSELDQLKKVVGAGLLRIGIKATAFNELGRTISSSQVIATRAWQDGVAIMNYLVQKNAVKLTLKRKEFPWPVIRELNAKLAVPDPEEINLPTPAGKPYIIKNNHQSQFPVIDVFYRTFLASGLAHISKGKYISTAAGKKLLDKPVIEQYITLLWGYLAELDWGQQTRQDGMAELSSHIDSMIQSMLPERFNHLLTLAGAKNNWVEYADLQRVLAKDSNHESDEGFGPAMFLSMSEASILWEPLQWFGLVELKEEEKLGGVMDTIAKIRLTELGHIILPQLATNHHSSETIHIRKIGRNEPCSCGSGKKYKKCCLDK